MSNDGHSPLPFVFTCVPYKFFCSRLAEIVLTGYHLCGKVGRVWVKRGESPLWVMSDLYQQHQPNEANSTSETWIDLQYCEWIWYILSASITIPRNFGWWQLSPFSISFIYIYPSPYPKRQIWWSLQVNDHDPSRTFGSLGHQCATDPWCPTIPMPHEMPTKEIGQSLYSLCSSSFPTERHMFLMDTWY